MLNNIKIEYKSSGVRFVKEVEFTFYDDMDGRITNAINAISITAGVLIRVSVDAHNGKPVSYFNFNDVKIVKIETLLSYSEVSVATYVVTCVVDNITRTID